MEFCDKMAGTVKKYFRSFKKILEGGFKTLIVRLKKWA